MNVNRLTGLGAFAFAMTLVSCGTREAKQPLMPGYYLLNQSKIGVERRIIITAGERRASYDVWRVSDTGDGTVRRAHYDLIAPDDAPVSGTFSITQEGSDCGTVSIEPYRYARTWYYGVLTVRRGVLGIEHFRVLRNGEPARYRAYDDAITRRMMQVASNSPHLYGRLSMLGKFLYSELNPRCSYD